MSELKTNKISTNDQNNVAMDNALQLKSYTTVERDALTSVAGDMIYNTTTAGIEYYDGSSWITPGAVSGTLSVDYLVIGGGGGGGAGNFYDACGGGGAGGYRTSYGSGNISGGLSAVESSLTLNAGDMYTVVIGAGAIAARDYIAMGNDTTFHTITSLGGGGGGGSFSYDPSRSHKARTGGSGGGGGFAREHVANFTGAQGTVNQGKAGGDAHGGSGTEPRSGGGGAGAGQDGSDGYSNYYGGDGGDGIQSSITGSAVYRGGGGGGSANYDQGGTWGTGGLGGGATSTGAGAGAAGTANTGGGGSGANPGGGGSHQYGGAGGSGVVILRYPNTHTISLGVGLTSTSGEQTDGTDKYIEINSGAGAVRFLPV